MPEGDFLEPDPIFAVVPVIIAVGGMIVLLGIIAVIVLTVRNARKVSRAGHDPLTLQADLAVKAMDSSLLAPARSIDDRLADLDRLRAADTISVEELAAARAEILGGRS